jgi:hypothetical protein
MLHQIERDLGETVLKIMQVMVAATLCLGTVAFATTNVAHEKSSCEVSTSPEILGGNMKLATSFGGSGSAPAQYLTITYWWAPSGEVCPTFPYDPAVPGDQAYMYKICIGAGQEGEKNGTRTWSSCSRHSGTAGPAC